MIFWIFPSMIEFTQQGGASGLSVLRTFRLLRILKLVRFMPALRRQLVVMLRTMDNVATFFALLVLFIFIFRWVWNDKCFMIYLNIQIICKMIKINFGLVKEKSLIHICRMFLLIKFSTDWLWKYISLINL